MLLHCTVLYCTLCTVLCSITQYCPGKVKPSPSSHVVSQDWEGQSFVRHISGVSWRLVEQAEETPDKGEKEAII